MSLAARSIYKISQKILTTIGSSLFLAMGVCLCAAVLSSGCTTASEKMDKKLKVGEPVVRVFFAQYEEVETALKQAMLKYPQRVDNTEAGIFETDYVKGDARFKPPQTDVTYSSGYRYRILIRLVKGKSEKNPAVKVVVQKQIDIVRDFFSEPDPIQSDGLEENVILYRIGRELTITRALKKSGEKQNQKQQQPQ
jgi:hypothetical protein